MTSLPVVEERQVCAVAYQGRVACFEILRGTLVWTRDVSSLSGLAADNRFLFVTDDTGAVHALDKVTGASAWKQDKLAPRRAGRPAGRRRFPARRRCRGLRLPARPQRRQARRPRADRRHAGDRAARGVGRQRRVAVGRRHALRRDRALERDGDRSRCTPPRVRPCRPRRRDPDAPHPRPRRPPERRQVDAVQPADAEPRGARRRFPGPDARPPLRARQRRRPAFHRRRHRRLRAGREERHPARDGEADARGDRRSRRRRVPGRRPRGPDRAGPQHRAAPAPLRAPGRSLAVNKAEGLAPERVDGRVPRARRWASRYPISAAHGENVDALDRARARRGARSGRRTTRRRPPGARDQGRDRRPPQRRQVDARQHAARRGARDRVRRARHDARRDLPRLRARPDGATR